MSSDIDLSACKIWLEITDTDEMIYAVCADKKIESINTTYVTRQQLMNSFKPYSDGTAVNKGTVVFGKNQSGTAQEWYILGRDNGVEGENTIIFAASPIVNKSTGQVFAGNSESNKAYEESFGKYVAVPSAVASNHYGASDLRETLQGMTGEGNTSYFTTAEQGLMNATTVKTADTYNKDNDDKNLSYTTTDKLYALQGDNNNNQYLLAGTNNRTVLDIQTYIGSTDDFWLRSPDMANSNNALLWESTNKNVVSQEVNSSSAVRPASNLNLSNVLFASASKAATSQTESNPVSGTIAADTALTLRLDGKDKKIGAAYFDAEDGVIVADKDAAATGTVSLVVQGNDGTNDWFYSVPVEGRTVVKADEIKNSCTFLNTAPNLTDCHIWLETSYTDARMIYAKPAEAKDISFINSVAVTGVKPVGGMAFTTASCTTTGIATTNATITYTTKENESDVAVTSNIADWNKTYKATFSLATGIENDVVYAFTDNVTVNIDGEGTDNTITPNADGTLTVTKEFTTLKRKIVSVTAPAVPADNTFTTYYGFEGNADTPLSTSESVSSNELGNQVTVTLEGTESVQSVTEKMNVTWTVANEDGARYNKTPGAVNTFRWTISKDDFTKYDASTCTGYDAQTGNLTDTIAINNKAATPVTITGTDSGENYTGVTIDVSKYFTLDEHAGTPTYSIITGTDGGTGEGNLSGSILTITKTGTFKIKVNTAANGIYGAGEATITLTVDNGTIQYAATDYSGTYDGQPHSIGVSVTSPTAATITYSTDKETYVENNPSFTDAGTYTVYYRIVKDNYNTVEGSKTVKIDKKSVTLTANDQSVMWNVDIDQSKYVVSENGLITGDSIKEITLTPSTKSLTETGKISINSVKIENASGKDVTGCYSIDTVDGVLKIGHNTTLALAKIEAVKTKTSYVAGDELNVDDLTVTVYYADDYSSNVLDYTTNVSDIDMSVIGDKTLTVSYTKNGKTVTKDIAIEVSHNTGLAPAKIEAVKTKISYVSEEELKLDDLTVTAYYADGYFETVNDYTTNVSDIDMSTIGDKTLTVSYTKNGKTVTKDIAIKVSHNTGLAPIRIEALKTKISYVAGDELNVDDLTVTAYYADGYFETVKDYTTNVSDIDMSTIGDKTLTVSYTKDDKTVTKDITIEVSHNTGLAPAKIEAVKTKTSYKAGDKLNVNDILVTVYYSDGYREKVSGYTTNASKINMAIIGNRILTVSYTKNGKTIKKNIIIKVSHNTGLAPTKIDAVKTKTSYKAGDKLNVNDISVTVYYSDGYREKVSGYTTNASKINMAVAGNKTLKVSYKKNGVTRTKDITIKVTKPKEIISQAKIKENSVKLDIHTAIEWKNNKLIVTWGKVNDASGYEIYATEGGNKIGAKSLVSNVSAKKTSATLTKIDGRKPSDKKAYMVIIKAYKKVNGKKVYIGTSSSYSVVGKNNRTYTNASTIKVTKKSVSLKEGKNSQIKATIVKQSSRKKLLEKSYGPSLRYISSNTSVATVTSKGNIKAKKKGSCYIYIKALNGKKTQVKVTVK